MQYVAQTISTLKIRLCEHYRRMKKLKRFENFLDRHSKRAGHSPGNVSVVNQEKNIYDENSTSKFKNIGRPETE